MTIHPLAGQPAPRSMLVDVPALISAYYTEEATGKVSFGTSGHRGSSVNGTFNEPLIAAIAQAICEYRAQNGITGPLFLGVDTHALSEPAYRTAAEVLAGNGVQLVLHDRREYTPTPVISFLILEHNRRRKGPPADGIVITPSHNPPEDGGFKYNPPQGGPADVDITAWIQERANAIKDGPSDAIKRLSYRKALQAENTSFMDFITPFVEALAQVVDMDAVRSAGLKIGVDPLGGSGIHYWAPIAERYGLNLEVVNAHTDPTFAFMPLDGDGKIRMDCSSPYAMSNLIAMAGRFDLAWGNDPDFDRHGIVCSSGLMNPNHYLSVAIWYLLQNRPRWRDGLGVGKTLVSSSMIDRVVAGLRRRLYEVPVGFKWFVSGLLEGSLAFGGEESAGAAFLRQDGSVWVTDKDGFCMTLLAAEIMARTGRSPDEIYRDELVSAYGASFYNRVDSPITETEKAVLKRLEPESIDAGHVAGLAIRKVLTRAPGNGAPIGGVKVILEDGSWFAVRPSGTEPKMKVYIESFGGEALWDRIYAEALPLVFPGTR